MARWRVLIGIGGAISTLANGINVGGGSSNSTVSTTYSQRIISIPPKSTIDLAPQYLFGNEIKKICEGAYLELFSNMSYIFIPKLYFNKKAGRMLVGDHYKYTEDNSPIQFNFIMSYSYDDSCASTKTLSAYFYMRDLMGFYSTNWSLVDRGGLPSDFVGLSSWVYVKSWNVNESFPKQ